MSQLFDWKIQAIERTANECKSKLYQLDSLAGDVGRLEYALREARAEADGLRRELETHQEKMTQLEARLDELSNNTTPPQT